eukprot:3314425-Alexandrium_andersonii.AAC.1
MRSNGTPTLSPTNHRARATESAGRGHGSHSVVGGKLAQDVVKVRTGRWEELISLGKELLELGTDTRVL